MAFPRRLRNGIYRNRWQYWWPWSTTRPWLPRYFNGSDENCNLSACFVLPMLGCVVIFWQPGPQRTEADGLCRECLAEFEAA